MTHASNPRLAGILAPLFSLRGNKDCGVGDLSSLAEFLPWAAEQGFGFVQMLPINETGSDHSPYNVISAYALEPSTLSVDPSDLPEVDYHEFEQTLISATGDPAEAVQYPLAKPRKLKLLESAFLRFKKLPAPSARRQEFRTFCRQQQEWLEPYSLYKALQDHLALNEVFTSWPDALQSHTSARQWLNGQKRSLQQKLELRKVFHSYIQWNAHRQWTQLRQKAEGLGIHLVGDVPVGVSRYSCDVWTWPQLFDLDRCCGAPPEKVFQADAFTERWGQNWGFPLYDWFAMSHDNFAWWRERLRLLRQIFPVLRIDHALGFFRIYSFPWSPERNEEFTELSVEEVKSRTGDRLPCFVERDDSTGENRARNELHGKTLLRILLEETGPEGILAEDLGEVPPYVGPALEELGIPGFKIPQWQTTPEGGIVPGKAYPFRSIATYATHDHPPIKTTWNGLAQNWNAEDTGRRDSSRRELLHLANYASMDPKRLPCPYDPDIYKSLLEAILRSNSQFVAYALNDLLGTEIRFNQPGVAGSQNWTARIPVKISDWEKKWHLEIAIIRSTIMSCRPRWLPNSN
jgi:4-alpha-glucanotransferase